jgi:hypothetical protein
MQAGKTSYLRTEPLMEGLMGRMDLRLMDETTAVADVAGLRKKPATKSK